LSNLGIDSKLRGCDLVSLKVRDVCHGDQVATRAVVMQHKTQRPVQFEITPVTREAVQKRIKQSGLRSEDFWFPSRVHGMYRRSSDHSSFRSSIMAPTSRVIEAPLGKMPTTFRHEGQDVVLPVVHEGAELGELSRSWSATDLHCARAASAESCTNTVPMAAETMRRCVLRPWTCNQASARMRPSASSCAGRRFTASHMCAVRSRRSSTSP
jgi:hypothetical protein